MRTNSGAGRRLAGRSWGGDDRFVIDVDADNFNDGPQDLKRDRDPDVLTGSYAPENLMRVAGVNTRPSMHETIWLMRAFDSWTAPSFSGARGAVGLRPGDTGQNPGNMVPWDSPRRTLRSLPLVPWDAGTAVGPGSASGA